ncbi:uncharacterized protein LOC134846327 [Symsagittifera roscoffensis]|uniref:uncharacterized protein LOC134846327 n=1 Tax=Symsagittifera roscoffensis TaxID=84072 RepID=UPI00307BA1F5
MVAKPTRTVCLVQFVIYCVFFCVRSVCHVFQIYIAQEYWHLCPAEPRLPIWNLVDAIFGLTFLTIEAAEKVIFRPSVFAKLRHYIKHVSASAIKVSCTASRAACAVFLCIWFFFGNFLVFAVSYDLVHDQNNTTDTVFSLVIHYSQHNQSETLLDIFRNAQHVFIPMDDWSSDNVCNATLYWASFWIIVGSYILIGLIFGAACSLAFCTLPVLKLHYCVKNWCSKNFSSPSFSSSKQNNYGAI